MKSSKSDLESEIFVWFNSRYPDGLAWTSKDFHCFRDAQLELRAVISTDKVEFEIANGGLSQLLWNTFFHWRNLFDDCEAGYRLFQAGKQQAAIQTFRLLFEQYETECKHFIDSCIAENDFSWFNRWCERAKSSMTLEEERLFYSDSGVEELRQKWLDQNKASILSLISS